MIAYLVKYFDPQGPDEKGRTWWHSFVIPCGDRYPWGSHWLACLVYLVSSRPARDPVSEKSWWCLRNIWSCPLASTLACTRVYYHTYEHTQKFKDLFWLMCLCLYECMPHMCGAWGDRGRHQISWSWSYPLNVGAENWPRVLWKSSDCS